MIAILYPLKMDKNLSEAYQKIYEVSAETALAASKERDKQASMLKGPENTEKRKELRTKASQNYNRAVEKRKAGFVKNTASPQGPSRIPTNEGTKHMKKFLDDKAKKLTKQRDAQPDAYKNNPHFDSTNPTSKSRTEAYDNRYSDNTGKESKEKLKKLEKKRGMSLKKHPQFTRDDVGKFRKEWEALKLVESDNYREQFDTWLDGIVEEGYDIDRWTDEELLDTFINENDLWESRESVSEALLSEADKKGKGSGKKDACYHKVKASASVWPSAYASGRLVQCRKKGAANYGNSKKEDFSDWRSDIQLNETPKVDKKLRKDATPIKPGPLYKLGRTKEQMGDKAVISRRNLRNAMSRGGVGSMTPAKETAERREKHKASRGVKTKGK